MKDHHPARGLEDRAQVRVQIDRRSPALPGLQERRDHVRGHRPGAKQGNIEDQIVKGFGRELT